VINGAGSEVSEIFSSNFQTFPHNAWNLDDAISIYYTVGTLSVGEDFILSHPVFIHIAVHVTHLYYLLTWCCSLLSIPQSCLCVILVVTGSV